MANHKKRRIPSEDGIAAGLAIILIVAVGLILLAVSVTTGTGQ